MSKIEWHLETREIDKLTPHAENPRIFTEKGMKDLKASINSIGMAQPINITPDGVILSGHARLMALKEKGVKQVDVYVPNRELTEKEQKEVLIRMNADNAGEWDFDKLANTWDSSELVEWGLDVPVFDENQNESAEVVEDEVPEEVCAKCKKGQLWKLGEHRLLCGDSTDENDIRTLTGGGKIDLLFTDPPYGVSYEKKTKEVLKSKEYTKIKNDDLTLDQFKDFLFDVFTNAKSVMKDTASYYIFSCQGGDQEMMMMMMMREAGLKCRHQIIWVKDAPVFSMGRLDYDYKHEPILYGWVKNHNFKRKGDQDKSVWEYKRTENKLHPTMKPIPLIVNALLNSTDENDFVLDLFGGSGSTLIACEQTNRKCFMMELDEHYCDVIIQRWENLTGQKAELLKE